MHYIRREGKKMKKSIVFLALSLFILIFFACDFKIPTAIEIIGTPSVRFVETVDVGKIFTDLLDDAFSKEERISVFPCEQTEYITYLIHVDLFTDIFNMEDAFHIPDFPGIDLVPPDFSYKLTEERTFIDTSKDTPDKRTVLPFSSIGSYLKGFEFSELKIRFYVSGTESAISKSKVDITYWKVETVDDEKEYTKMDTIANIPVENKKSDIDDWKINGYNETSYPDDGADLSIPINGEDISFSFRVYFPVDTVLKVPDFQDGDIDVEVVIWLPFKLEVMEDEAEITFPEDSFFSSEDDLFTREEPDEDNLFLDIIESLSVNVKFQKNPFTGADLIVESKGIEIHNLIMGNALSFTVTEDDMKLINDPENFPFTPNLKIRFSDEGTVSFPRAFIATEFGLTAKIRYKIDLQ
jgi:hypothetical protein